MATSNPSPYDAAIEELEGKIRHFQNVLETLKGLRSSQGEGASTTPAPGARESDTEIRHDSFFGMTIADAARKYLTMVKQTKSTAEMAEALERGGLKHASKDFPMTVRAVISPRDEFVRVNNDWGLTEWYPGMRKDKKEKKAKPPKARKKAKAKKTAPPAPAETSSGHASVQERAEQSLRRRIITYLDSHPNQAFKAAAVALALGANLKPTAGRLSELATAGKVSKSADGYKSKPQAAATAS